MKLSFLENCEKSLQLQNLADFLEILYEERYFKTLKAALKKPEIQPNAFLQKLPLLCSDTNQFINNYYTIIKYICAKSDLSLIGKNLESQMLCDQTLLLVKDLDNNLLNLELILEKKENKEDLNLEINRLFKVLDDSLNYNTFVAGTHISYADFLVAFSYRKFKKLSPNAKFVNVSRVTKFIEHSGLKFVN